MSEVRYITFALGKGRLAERTLELLEEIGITCEEMKDKKTRKLIFVNEEQKLKFFLSKGPDVLTYVEYGAADIGVVGKDTILEENRRVYEVLDLGYGKCKMCVCGPASARELLQHHEMIRVASKYPNIAKDYFYNKKHQTVDIIKLNGSVELGPIVGLSDVIVDIVETGSTLKENGLEVLEEVCPLSARMIVNQVSMQMEQAVKEGKIQDYLIPIDAMFSDLKDCVVSDEALRLLLNGNCIAKKDTSYQMPKDKERVRMYSMENEFYAIYEYRQREDKYFVVKMF